MTTTQSPPRTTVVATSTEGPSHAAKILAIRIFLQELARCQQKEEAS